MAWAVAALFMCAGNIRAEYLKAPRAEDNYWLYLSILLGLTTFFAHGLVNNLLHDTCIAAWVWGQAGVLTAHAARRNAGTLKGLN
jgi:hypothetical protein